MAHLVMTPVFLNKSKTKSPKNIDTKAPREPDVAVKLINGIQMAIIIMHLLIEKLFISFEIVIKKAKAAFDPITLGFSPNNNSLPFT